MYLKAKAMTKSNLLFLLMILIISSCSATAIKDYEENLLLINNIKGNVKSIHSEIFEAEEKFGVVHKGEARTFYFYFPVNSIISGNSFYEFTQEGKLKTREIYFEDFSEKLTWTYDDSWNVIQEVYKSELNDEQHEIITKYKFDKGKLVSSDIYDKNGQVLGKSNYVLENDLIKEVSSIFKEEKITSKVKYSDSNSVQIHSTYNGDGELTQEYKRDINGRTLEKFVKTFDERTHIVYEYGNVFPVEIKVYKNKEMADKLELAFDDKFNITEIKEMDKYGVIDRKINFTYRFDEIGNWIEQAAYADGNIEYLTTRKIEYFKN